MPATKPRSFFSLVTTRQGAAIVAVLLGSLVFYHFLLPGLRRRIFLASSSVSSVLKPRTRPSSNGSTAKSQDQLAYGVASVQNPTNNLPPTLIAPAELQKIVAAESLPVEFIWTEVPGANLYRLRIARDAEFASTVYDRRLTLTNVKVSDLSEGIYYWNVRAQLPGLTDSLESETNQFVIESSSILLELAEPVQYGNTLKVHGKTSPGFRIAINGQNVPVIQPNGSFDYFTPPLKEGENTITVTARGPRGEAKTVHQKVVIR